MRDYIVYNHDGIQHVEGSRTIIRTDLDEIIERIRSGSSVGSKYQWFYASTSRVSLLGLPKMGEGERLVFDFYAVDRWLSYKRLYRSYHRSMRDNDVEPAGPPIKIERSADERGIVRSRKAIQALLDHHMGGEVPLSLPQDVFKYEPVQKMLKLLKVDISNTSELEATVSVTDRGDDLPDVDRFSNLVDTILLPNGKINSTLMELTNKKIEGRWFTGARVDKLLQAVADLSFLTKDPKVIWKALVNTSLGEYQYSTLKEEAGKSEDPVNYIGDLIKIEDPRCLIIELNKLSPTFPYIQSFHTILKTPNGKSEFDQEVISR